MDRKLLLLAAAVVLMGSLDFFKGYIAKVGLEDAPICYCASRTTDEGTSDNSAKCASPPPPPPRRMQNPRGPPTWPRLPPPSLTSTTGGLWATASTSPTATADPTGKQAKDPLEGDSPCLR